MSSFDFKTSASTLCKDLLTFDLYSVSCHLKLLFSQNDFYCVFAAVREPKPCKFQLTLLFDQTFDFAVMICQ